MFQRQVFEGYHPCKPCSALRCLLVGASLSPVWSVFEGIGGGGGAEGDRFKKIIKELEEVEEEEEEACKDQSGINSSMIQPFSIVIVVASRSSSSFRVWPIWTSLLVGEIIVIFLGSHHGIAVWPCDAECQCHEVKQVACIYVL